VKPDDVARGVALFDAGRYWDAHEAWEIPWREAQGSPRAVLQALILWAAALHQHQRGITAGSRTLLKRAVQRLNVAHDGAYDFDLEKLRDALADTWTQLERGNVTEVVRLSTLRAEPQEPVLELDHRATCPYCGEPVMVSIEAQLAGGTTYVEDCPVCCRPWEVRVRGGDLVTVELGRYDD
jgi:predicted metal-dependent hydrolase